MADADVTLDLYLAQQPDVLAACLHTHLHALEFPFAEANARMEWDGVPVSKERIGRLRDGLHKAVKLHREALAKAGLENPRSPKQVQEFLIRRGHRDRLIRNGKMTTADSVLKPLEPLDPSVMHLRRYRRYSRMLAEPMFAGELIGSDVRLHRTTGTSVRTPGGVHAQPRTSLGSLRPSGPSWWRRQGGR